MAKEVARGRRCGERSRRGGSSGGAGERVVVLLEAHEASGAHMFNERSKPKPQKTGSELKDKNNASISESPKPKALNPKP